MCARDVSVYISMCFSISLHVCVCARACVKKMKREREINRRKCKKGKRNKNVKCERGKEIRRFVCVCVCVCVKVRVTCCEISFLLYCSLSENRNKKVIRENRNKTYHLLISVLSEILFPESACGVLRNLISIILFSFL